MKNIKEIFDEISSIGSTNEKMAILKSYKETLLLKNVLYLIYSRRVKFYVKQIPVQNENRDQISLAKGLSLLNRLSNREVTGDNARDHLKDILESLSKDNAYIIERIIDKDAKIGMGSTNINKIYPNLIEKTPYMGATSYSKKAVDNLFEKYDLVYSQVKMDGRYCNATIENGEVYLESRAGEVNSLEGAKFYQELSQLSDCVLNGELILKDFPDRYKANGMILSLITIGNKIKVGENVSIEINKFNTTQPMSYLEALSRIQFIIWDMILIEEYEDKICHTPYKKRLNITDFVIKNSIFENVKLIESKIVKSKHEAMAHFQEMLKRGEEGTILKSGTEIWKDGKPKYQIKFKLIMSVDLIIAGFQYGTKGTKNDHLITSLLVESTCGKLKTKASGMKEVDMKYITDNMDSLLGKVVEVESCGVSQNSKSEHSLLHPVFIEIRHDKDTGDDLKSILSIEQMILGLK